MNNYAWTLIILSKMLSYIFSFKIYFSYDFNLEATVVKTEENNNE